MDIVTNAALNMRVTIFEKGFYFLWIYTQMEKRMANLQYFCFKNITNSMKGKKIGHWQMSHPAQYMFNMVLGKSGEITPERMKRLAQSRNDAQLWMCLVVKLTSDVVKNNIG